jgi:hypothetical protein
LRLFKFFVEKGTNLTPYKFNPITSLKDAREELKIDSAIFFLHGKERIAISVESKITLEDIAENTNEINLIDTAVTG